MVQRGRKRNRSVILLASQRNAFVTNPDTKGQINLFKGKEREEQVLLFPPRG